MTPAHPLVLALVLTLGPVGVAGCLEADGGAPPAGGDAAVQHRVGGAFTENATQADIQDLSRRATSRGGDAAILESFPPQFMATLPNEEACREFLAEAETLPFVADVGECRAVEPAGGDPNEPTSSR